MTLQALEQLKPFEARAIIEDLRKGSVPIEYVPFFTVGRQNWLKFIGEDLDNYIAEGGREGSLYQRGLWRWQNAFYVGYQAPRT